MSENDSAALSADLKSQASEVLQRASEQISDQAGVLRDVAADARYHTEDFIQTRPWTAVALAAGLGFFVGVIVARR